MNLNYKHLYYFMLIAEEGSISRAAERLHLAPQTVSAQLAQLEERLGTRLLKRVGRHWVVTEAGAQALEYAKDIFKLGKELSDVMRGALPDRPLEMRVGISDTIPKILAHRLITPALQLEQDICLRCYEGRFDDLVARLAVHSLDVVIADRPLGRQLHVRAHNHLLAQSGLTFIAAPKLVTQREFPACLQGLPFLMPTEQHWLSLELQDWFQSQRLQPKIRGWFEDSALLKTFAKQGLGACAMPSMIADELCAEYGLLELGRIQVLQESYYAVTVERKIQHPGVQAICQTEVG